MRAENAYSHLMRGAAYQNKGDLEKALSDYTKAIQLDPNEYLAYFRRAKLYEILKKNDLAAADDREFRRRAGEKAKPQTAEEFYDRAVYFEDRGFWGDAIYDYSEAIKLDPGLKKGFPFSNVYEKRADLYALGGKDEEALRVPNKKSVKDNHDKPKHKPV
jgi:tetratricopeptide (TPR) repeat protein